MFNIPSILNSNLLWKLSLYFDDDKRLLFYCMHAQTNAMLQALFA